jgi:hypothetical protein
MPNRVAVELEQQSARDTIDVENRFEVIEFVDLEPLYAVQAVPFTDVTTEFKRNPDRKEKMNQTCEMDVPLRSRLALHVKSDKLL